MDVRPYWELDAGRLTLGGGRCRDDLNGSRFDELNNEEASNASVREEEAATKCVSVLWKPSYDLFCQFPSYCSRGRPGPF